MNLTYFYNIFAMGNKTSDTSNQEVQIKITHPNLTLSKLITNNGENMLKTSICMDKKEYQKWESTLACYPHSPTLFLPLQHAFTKTSLCGTAGTVEVYYPNYPYLLYDQIYDRLNKQLEFNEQDMWYLLYAMIQAKAEALNTNELLGDIRPKNILLNDQGQIKIPTLHSFPLELNKYQKALDNTITYLAPEEIKFLEIGTIDTYNLTEPAEMFSIGLTTLAAANLQDYDPLYNFQTLKFDFQKFDSATSELIINNHYSEILRSTILNLCSIDPKRRMTFAELFDILYKHEEAINGRLNFVIDNAPSKLHDEVSLLRTIFLQKAASYPSSLPDQTDQGYPSTLSAQNFQKLVPSHLNENTTSALQND